ncbi:MAG: SHOCT domain-containing protein, partial [Sphingomicrobium sp.]
AIGPTKSARSSRRCLPEKSAPKVLASIDARPTLLRLTARWSLYWPCATVAGESTGGTAMNEQRVNFEAVAQIAEMTELVVGQIKRLAELHDAGILTDEEFSAKKQELLARL